MSNEMNGVETSSFPDWSELTPDFAAAELPKILSAAEAAVTSIEMSSPADYEGLVWKLDDATRDLWQMWGAVGHMMGVMKKNVLKKI